jgi:hypothetical protein
MATFNKIQDFAEQLGLARHNLSTHTLKAALTTAANMPVATDTVLADVSQPTGTGYTAGGEDTLNSFAEAGGTATLTGTKVVWTAGAGDWTAFQGVVLYNDDTTTPTDQLIGWWDRGTPLTLGNGETFTVKWNNGDPTGTILSIA